jgi:hypothetical protein
MANIERTHPERARQHTAANSALLVCAYDSEERFRQNHLEGAISLAAFKSRLHTIPKTASSFSTVRDRMMSPLPGGGRIPGAGFP